jgi:hypothetical protein
MGTMVSCLLFLFNERTAGVDPVASNGAQALIATENETRSDLITRGKGRDMRSACDPVHAEQVRSSYAHLPLTLSISVLNSILLGFVLAPVASERGILIWIGLVIGLSALAQYCGTHIAVQMSISGITHGGPGLGFPGFSRLEFCGAASLSYFLHLTNPTCCSRPW